jgi:hypothetical protein
MTALFNAVQEIHFVANNQIAKKGITLGYATNQLLITVNIPFLLYPDPRWE